ncbi:carbohydrate ABC transporter permease [Halorubrum lipolyticum]|uniref:Binding-protein-dependent transport systems inner membrane component n=1 Tax=Halorubrum lipolyticum DSM 21995 TaxID=1227482 RepID=M0NSK0_9EURY|nr:carbohydrate ABC transporter permease [Halorubrum lipolyticum]EMA59585.1 binding-protein-dependent transport systems inner membrane component [Halorubrum lipolyticum DSM 21995]
MSTDSKTRFTIPKPKTVGLYVTLYGAAFLFIVPYLYMVSTSLKTEDFAFSQQPYWIPPEITFQWYQAVLQGAPILQWLINTLVIAGATTIIVVIIDSMIAFSLTKLDWPGKRIVFTVIIASFMVPIYANMVPLYTIISDFGLLNSPLAVILPFSAIPIGVFLFTQFFKDLPDSVIEAAKLDGFSTFQIYLRIVLPLMKPAIAALSLYTFVYTWNQFLWPLIVLQGETSFTLPVGIVTTQPTQVFQPGAEMAVTLIAAAPLFIVFLILQEHLVNAVQMQGTTG